MRLVLLPLFPFCRQDNRGQKSEVIYPCLHNLGEEDPGLKTRQPGPELALLPSLWQALQQAIPILYQTLAPEWTNEWMTHLLHLRRKWLFYKVTGRLIKVEPWNLGSLNAILYLECHPSQTGRKDSEWFTVKVLLVDKRPNYTPRRYHPKAVSVLPGSGKYWQSSTPPDEPAFLPSPGRCLTQGGALSALWVSLNGWAWLEGRIPTQVPGTQLVFNTSLFIYNDKIWPQNCPFLGSKHGLGLIFNFQWLSASRYQTGINIQVLDFKPECLEQKSPLFNTKLSVASSRIQKRYRENYGLYLMCDTPKV